MNAQNPMKMLVINFEASLAAARRLDTSTIEAVNSLRQASASLSRIFGLLRKVIGDAGSSAANAVDSFIRDVFEPTVRPQAVPAARQ